MNENKTETFSVRVPTEVKNQFLELFKQSTINSKPELFKNLLDNYIKKNDEPIVKKEEEALPSSEKEQTPGLENNPEKVIESKVDIIIDEKEDILSTIEEDIPETIVDVDKQIKEITLKLNPAQVFALRETVLNNGFIDDVNKVVNKIDTANDTSLFGNSLFSGAYKGIFTEMNTDSENEEVIVENMGIALINHFISSIVFGACDLQTPITQTLLKVFLQENEKTETTLISEPKQL